MRKKAPQYSSGFVDRDLADIRKEGKLSKDEFAVAMFLINNKLAGKELPSSLSQSMIPPSLRNHSAVTQPQSKRSVYEAYDRSTNSSPISPPLLLLRRCHKGLVRCLWGQPSCHGPSCRPPAVLLCLSTQPGGIGKRASSSFERAQPRRTPFAPDQPASRSYTWCYRRRRIWLNSVWLSTRSHGR